MPDCPNCAKLKAQRDSLAEQLRVAREALATIVSHGSLGAMCENPQALRQCVANCVSYARRGLTALAPPSAPASMPKCAYCGKDVISIKGCDCRKPRAGL